MLSVGRIAYEPLWVFYAGSGRLERLTDLKGKRILVGPAGGGTSGLALRMLAANGVTAENATLINRELPDYVDVLAKGEADAGFLVLAPEARTIQRLLRTPNVHLMSFANADAYTQRFPFLTRLVLREGVVDFAANIPPADTTLIATTTAVLVREDAHRALVNLLAQALHEAHGQPVADAGNEAQLFQRVGEFPMANDPEFALSEDARRVYRSGPPVLQRYMPFWVATMLDRLMLSLVVLLPILIPLHSVCAADLQLAHPATHHVLVWRAEAAGGGRQERVDPGGAGCETGRARPHRSRRGQHPCPAGFRRPALRAAPARRAYAPAFDGRRLASSCSGRLTVVPPPLRRSRANASTWHRGS